MKNKNILIIGIFVILISNVLAFAVSSEYWEENPLVMSPGETIEIPIILQNMAGSEAVEAQATIISENNLAKITDTSTTYIINPGEKTTMNILISIPENSAITNDKVIISLKTKTNSQENFGFGSGLEKEIPIVVKAPENKYSSEKNYSTYGVIIVLFIVLMILLLPKLKRKNKKRK